MKEVVASLKTVLVAFAGLIGGIIWAILSHLDPEPIILVIVSVIEIIGFFYFSLKGSKEKIQQEPAPIINNGNVNVSVSLGTVDKSSMSMNSSFEKSTILVDNREAKIEYMKSKTKILFIDDDKNFNVVKILKNSGWKNTKSIIDVKSIDSPVVKDANIHFVDINGVGKSLRLPNEGLDLALMIKQRYPEKKVIIYSANRNSNSFHEAWNICDFKLEKNALPNQFQNLVEQYSIDLYNLIK